MVRIIDCGSQVTHNIARRIREQEVYADVRSWSEPLHELLENSEDGIIISGGPFSVYDKDAPIVDARVMRHGVPVLGICYGLQLIAEMSGGKVSPAATREYGAARIMIERDSPLFEGLPREIPVWMSHGDIVEKLPPGFEVVARSHNGHIAAMQDLDRRIFAVQFHPEVDNTPDGRKILENFVKITGAERTWTTARQRENISEYVRSKTEGKVGVCACSGGVDSTTASVLVSRLTSAFNPILVDNGLLRDKEAQQIMRDVASYVPQLRLVDAADRFLALRSAQ